LPYTSLNGLAHQANLEEPAGKSNRENAISNCRESGGRE
jgi:hypothetical protein